MAFTTIKLIRNKTPYDIGVSNHEHPADTDGNEHVIAAGDEWTCSMGIPWHDNVFYEHVIEFAADPGASVTPAVNVSLYIYTQNGYVWCAKSVPEHTGVSGNAVHVAGAATEGGDRSVDITGSTNDDLQLTFW